jgi:hypothetical protein
VLVLQPRPSSRYLDADVSQRRFKAHTPFAWHEKADARFERPFAREEAGLPMKPPPKKRYEQRNDPSLSPFMGKGSYIGSLAMAAQISGRRASAAQVRVVAKPFPEAHMGQGLHEVVPTNLRDKISSIPAKQTRTAAAEVQSGARTTPALTPFYFQGMTGGHIRQRIWPLGRPNLSASQASQALRSAPLLVLGHVGARANQLGANMSGPGNRNRNPSLRKARPS